MAKQAQIIEAKFLAFRGGNATRAYVLDAADANAALNAAYYGEPRQDGEFQGFGFPTHPDSVEYHVFATREAAERNAW